MNIVQQIKRMATPEKLATIETSTIKFVIGVGDAGNKEQNWGLEAVIDLFKAELKRRKNSA